MKTMTELRIEETEELRRSEIRFWQKMHPKAKVVLEKDRIVITYPLPEDFAQIKGFIANY